MLKHKKQRLSGAILLGVICVALFFTTVHLSIGAAQDTNAALPEMPPEALMPIRGVVRAEKEAKLSTELRTRVNRIAFEAGQSFKKGDSLIELDCRGPRAELQAAKAQQKEAQLQRDGTAFLVKRGAGSRQELGISEARLEQAKAQVAILSARIEQCNLKAPFDGAVYELNIMESEMTALEKPLLSIVSKNNPYIELIVPSNWLAWLKMGTEFEFRVDETQDTFRAVVDRLGAKIEAGSQTIKAYARFASDTSNILVGMSGVAQFTKPNE
ncbi:efflux RND transporter periplasmic adaptor subunit [uncultured Cohaesibacter sp.]|uniref:efflux RND transporter periplasmic adaptor subunit n=1 Tax=uncultured Cohaesibacter sp. TaxID=1002546 RepID=UPI00292FCDFA|nr:efflux RND transporter periplasmic adaptor subunit [uncultured Cohaesibacter sp.]